MSTIGPGLRWVVEECRANRSDSDFVRFRFGEPLAADDLAAVVPEDIRNHLKHEGRLDQDGSCVSLTVSCDSLNGIVSIMPAMQERDADHVHLNVDALWLLTLVWRLVTPGGRAAELGTGNGFIAAYLTARFRQVVATDIHGPSMRHAQLTLAANRVRGRDSSLVCADVAGGLKQGVFDLVVANPPWSPAYPRDDQGRVVTFADGGPTGTEMPSRFLRQGAALLAPGGTAIVLALDPTYDDGRRPLLDTLDEIAGEGFDVDVIESEVFDPGRILRGLSQRIDGLVAASHVAVVLRRGADSGAHQ